MQKCSRCSTYHKTRIDERKRDEKRARSEDELGLERREDEPIRAEES
jgi:hypothetical protein